MAMKELVENIINKNYEAANVSLEEEFNNIMSEKLHEMKKMYAAKMSEQNTHTERQKRLKMDVLEAEEVDENLLKIGKKNLKMRSPMVRANASQRMEEEEVEQLDEAPRVGIVKLRIRGGKIQRRKKVSNVPGMTLRGGKLTRMSPAERRKRKLGAKIAARKTKSKRSQILRKRKMSLMKRQRLGG